MKVLTAVILIICITNSIPQTIYANLPREYEIFLIPQGYGIKLLNSKGTSAIINNVSNISALNPASIQQFKDLSFGLSYQFQTDIPSAYAFDIGTSRVYNYLPQSFGGVYKYENFSFGIGIGQRYNGTMDLGKIEITSVADPDGTGEFYEPTYERTLQNFSFATSYNFKDLLTENSDLSIGLRYNFNRLYNYERIGNIHAEGTIFGSNAEIGVFYKTKFEKDKNIFLGVSYSIITELEGEMKYESDNELFDPDPSDSNFYAIEAQPFTAKARIPDELHFDFGIEATGNLQLNSSIIEIFWNNSAENVRNQIEFSSSVVYSFNLSLKGSFGFYYTDRNYIDDVLDINGKMDALFFTAGLSFDVSIFNVDLALADSHLYSGEFRKQTIGKIALEISL